MVLIFRQWLGGMVLMLLFIALIGPAEAGYSNDLTIGYIQRLPEIDYVWNSSNPTREGWPEVGQTVTWRAKILNFSTINRNQVTYHWYLDDEEVARGTVDIAARSSATLNFDWDWTFERHRLHLIIDADDAVGEDEEGNNDLMIYTDAITVGFYVEKSLYDYFHEHQHKLGVQSNCWENWAQRQVEIWNQIFADAVYPETPDGVLDRIRIDNITIVADGALPLAGGLAGNHPNRNDRSVDLQWGFPATLLDGDFYADHETVSDRNKFYYEGSLIHELGHARYLIDGYGFNVSQNEYNIIDITEDGEPVAGSKYMPYERYDITYFFPYGGLMNSEYHYVDRYSAVALNLIAGHRAIRGNYNSPGNIGVFLSRDLPEQNQLTVRDIDGNILPSAQVQIYRATEVSGAWYGKYYDDAPDMELTTDSYGRVSLGHNPFDDAGSIRHTYGLSNGVLIVRVDYHGAVGYGFICAPDFNLEYWRGHTEVGIHEVKVNLIGTPQRLVRQYYREFLGWDVQPDFPGFDSHVDNLLQFGCYKVVMDFVQSGAFAPTKGSVSNRDYVRILYRAILSREPDGASNGSQWWVAQLNAGSVTRDAIVDAMYQGWEPQSVCETGKVIAEDDSPPPQPQPQPEPEPEPEVQLTREERLVRQYYREFLGWDVQPDFSGFDWHANNLLQFGCRKVVMDFVQSGAFAPTKRSVSNRDYVRILYRTILSREPDGLSNGSEWWVAQLNAGSLTRDTIIDAMYQGWEPQTVCESGKIIK